MYKYTAKVIRVVDGDTFDVNVDLGFGNFTRQRLRLKDVDTPETYRPSCQKEKEHGIKATERVKELIEGKNVSIEVFKEGSFGRWASHVFVLNHKDCLNVSLGKILKEEGLLKLESYGG